MCKKFPHILGVKHGPNKFDHIYYFAFFVVFVFLSYAYL